MTPQRSRSFGSAAATYERYRPEYPDIVVELVRGYAGIPLRSALELGAGTGKATRVVARHGISVTASEPDPAMLAELRDQVPGVDTIAATLESLPPMGPFDLVLAAASLHWTEADGRWERIAGLLVPGGVFANVGKQPELVDPELEEAVRDAHRPWLIDDSAPQMDRPSDSGMHWPAVELMENSDFTDVRETVIEQRLELLAADWVGYLSTVSAYLVLSERDRAAALDAIAEVLPEVVEVRADLTLHLARRA